jgi:hypothetical protein
MEFKSVNKQTQNTHSGSNTKGKTQAAPKQYFSKIEPMKKNMFTDACFEAGLLKEKPEIDFALFKAYEEVKKDLCNNNIYEHLDKQEERGFSFVRYVLNFDPKTKKYKSNIVEVTTPGGYHYKIVKTQFFTNKNIRDIFYQKIADWYKLKFDLTVKFSAKQINPRTWNCAVYVQNPVLSTHPEQTDFEDSSDVEDVTDDGKATVELEEISAWDMQSN